jgi:branched-chain amino acid transport system permease protein
VALSEFTKAWQLYLGLFFVLLVMFAPGGLASLILMNLRVLKFRKFARLRDPYFGVIAAAAVLAAGVVMLVELTYHLTLDYAAGPQVRVFGLPLSTDRAESWVLMASVIAAGAAGFEYMRRVFKAQWDAIAVEIEDWLRENPDDR